MLLIWLKFIVAAAIVVFCGYKICIYAEEIARLTRIGRTFIGLVLLAVVTSLPELAVTLSATKIGALDLALGDLFGSNLFNLSIVGLIWLVFTKKPKLLPFAPVHVMSASVSLVLIALPALGIVFYNFINPDVGYSRVLLDIETALILVIYILGAHLISRTEGAQTTPELSKKSAGGRSPAGVWVKFVIYSSFLVGAATYLAHLGDRIAQIPVGGAALGGTFVGSLLIAVITSLPEMVVSISAVKLGFLDMALGNIFGSNMFNMLIIPITDLALGRKAILSCVSAQHLFTIIFVIITTGLVTSSLIYRSRKKAPALAWDSFSILFVYFAANLVNFYLR